VGGLAHAKPRSREGQWAVVGIPAAQPVSVALGSPDRVSVARAFQPEHCAARPCRFWLLERKISRAGGPLTPDPSPPFHGGEGRIACSVVSQWRQFGSREAAKPRRETHGGR